jgi:predicted DNA-binding transcriptional regulator AlpA
MQRFVGQYMSQKKLLPERKVCQRYGVCLSTLWRWDRDEALGFPKPIVIRKRKYRLESDLDVFDAKMSQRTSDET